MGVDADKLKDEMITALIYKAVGIDVVDNRWAQRELADQTFGEEWVESSKFKHTDSEPGDRESSGSSK